MKLSQSGDQAPKKYPKEDARKIFQKALEGGGWVSRKHARIRQIERGIDNNDILNLSKTGVILNEPELDIKTNQMKYTIESLDHKLKIVFNVLDDCRVRLITVMND